MRLACRAARDNIISGATLCIDEIMVFPCLYRNKLKNGWSVPSSPVVGQYRLSNYLALLSVEKENIGVTNFHQRRARRTNSSYKKKEVK